MDLSCQQIRRIERLAIEGVSQKRIARDMRLSREQVDAVLVRSQVVCERNAEQADRRRRRDDQRRRLLCRDMARAQRLPFLPEHRDARGLIDWPSVKGWEDWREIARQAAQEAM